MTTLGRKMSCADAKDRSRASAMRKKRSALLSGSCSDRVVCEHLSEHHSLYNNNLIVRAGEVGLLKVVDGFQFSHFPALPKRSSWWPSPATWGWRASPSPSARRWRP